MITLEKIVSILAAAGIPERSARSAGVTVYYPTGADGRHICVCLGDCSEQSAMHALYTSGVSAFALDGTIIIDRARSVAAAA